MTSTLDLIQAIHNKEPVDAERMFSTIMADRIADRIEDMKAEVAKTMFSAREELEASVDEDSGTSTDETA